VKKSSVYVQDARYRQTERKKIILIAWDTSFRSIPPASAETLRTRGLDPEEDYYYYYYYYY